MNYPNLRFEFKYEIDLSVAQLIEHELGRWGMKLDSNASASDGSYIVMSLYFDTYGYHDYYENAGGFLRRKKTRARVYESRFEDATDIWLEVKHKINAQNFKNRIKLTNDEFGRFLKNGVSALMVKTLGDGKAQDKEAILREFLKAPVRPVAIVRYRRKAFMNESQNIRINFDSELETCKENHFKYYDFMVPVQNGGVIMEVKYAYALPYWLGHIIRKYNLRRVAFSKYGRCLEALQRHHPLAR